MTLFRSTHLSRRIQSLAIVGWLALCAAGCRNTEPPAVEPPPPVPPVADTTATPSADASAAEPTELALGRDAHYGIYLMGKKIGHARVWDRDAKSGEPGRHHMGFAMKMAVGGGGQKNELEATEERYYAGSPDYALVETRFASTAMGFRDERRAVPAMAGNKPVMRITRSLGGAAGESRDAAPSADTLLAQLAISPLSLDGLEVGDKRSARVWSWERESDETVSSTVESLSDRNFSGVQVRVAALKVVYETTGIEGKSFVSDNGTMLEMTLGAGLVLKLEEASVAKSGVVGLDILGTGMVSPTKLGSPHAVDRLELTLTGPAGVKVPMNPNQAVSTTLSEDGLTATHEVVLVRGPGAKVKDEELTEALAADATMDADHPAIVAQAKSLTGELATPRAKVEAVGNWVHEVLDKKLATHLPTASTILEKMVGDCTEHTWLTVALLRAVGIPSRPVYGVGYTGDLDGVFAYHAWVEVALEGRWEMIDPTWGQASADATHLRLGATLGEVANSIGGLTVTRAEVKSAP